jgi:hypothetical protein
MQQDTKEGRERLPYASPSLEQHGNYVQLTGDSFPFRLPLFNEIYEDLTEEPGV